MKTRFNNRLILVIISLLISFEINSQEFSSKEKQIIYTEAFKLLKNYEIFSKQIGNLEEKETDRSQVFAEKLIDCFVNRKFMVFNDLDPSGQMSEFLEIETYATNLYLWYPDGIITNLDFNQAKVNEINALEQDVFFFDVLLNKSLSGNFNNTKFNKSSNNLLFRVAFTKIKNAISHFKIAGIRKEGSNKEFADMRLLTEVKAAQLSVSEKTTINDLILNLIRDYSNSLKLIANPKEPAEDKEIYVNDFLKFFRDSICLVYNDLEPESGKSTFSANDYIQNYAQWYAQGINNLELKLDSSDIRNIVPLSKTKFYTYAFAEKFFSGSYKGKTMHRTNDVLIFKISFNKEGGSFSNLKIEDINKEEPDFYKTTDQSREITQPALPLNVINRKGTYISMFVKTGKGTIENPNLTEEGSYWKISGKTHYSAGYKYFKFIDNHVGINAGIAYKYFESEYNVNSDIGENEYFADSKESHDIGNNRLYYKRIYTKMDSTIKLNMISIPLGIEFISGSSDKTGFYFSADLQFTYIILSNYNTNGEFHLKGYYPDNEMTYELEQTWEFYSRPQINASGKTDNRKLNVGFSISSGIYIPLGYFSALKLGAFYNQSITDLKDVREYYNFFGDKMPYKKTRLKAYGLEISYLYKL